MDHAQHDSVDTHHLTTAHDIDLQSSPALPSAQALADPPPPTNDQQPRDGEHGMNSSSTASPRPSKRKLPDNDLQSSPNCRCDPHPPSPPSSIPDTSHMPRLVIHPSTVRSGSPIPTTSTLGYLSVTSNLSSSRPINDLAQPFSAPPTHAHFDTSNPKRISSTSIQSIDSHRSHPNHLVHSRFKPALAPRLSPSLCLSPSPLACPVTPYKKSRNLSPASSRSVSSSMLQPSQLHCHSSQPSSHPLQVSNDHSSNLTHSSGGASSTHSSAQPGSENTVTHSSCRATSLPPSSSCKKRRKDDDVAAKSSTKAGLRAIGLGPKLSRGFRTRSGCRKSFPPNFPSALPIGSAYALPSTTPSLTPSTSASSSWTRTLDPLDSRQAVYRSRSSDEFTLPDPAPIYVQLVARHAIDLPRANPLCSGLAVHSFKANAYARSLKRMLPTCDPQLSSRFHATPEIHLPSWTPPITRSSMAELEFVEVLKNAQLRHDIVFDDVLRFRPNLDGDRGERKRLIADRYWLAIAKELETSCRCTAFLYRPSDRYILGISPQSDLRRILPCVCSAGSANENFCKPGTIPLRRIPSRFPGLVDELRNILLSLVAPRSPALCQSHINGSSGSTSHSAHDLISSTLDPKTICGHLERRTLDLSHLANFLGLVLKGHCAPMRDSIVDGMVALIAGTEEKFTLEPDAPNAAHDSLQKCEYVGLAGGLRMSFELLELMKLDIANHQLRTLRPLLLETALEFEIRYFREHLTKKPSVERTKKWFQEALNRVHVADPSTINVTTSDKVARVVQDGLLELVFNANITSHQQPWGLSPLHPFPFPTAAGLVNAVNRGLSTSNSSRLHRHIWSPAPSPSQIPETLSMDTIRLQNLHSDISDLTVAYMLIMLFKQLVGHSNLRPGDVDTIKTEIWVFMSEPVMKMKHPERKTLPGIGLKKIEVSAWRRALEDVLLHLAARVETIRQRSKPGVHPEGPSAAPNAELVKTVKAWMDSQVRTGSKLFQLAQKRLRQTFEAILAQEMTEAASNLSVSEENNMAVNTERYGIPTVLRTGRTTIVDSDESLSSTIVSNARGRSTAELAASMAAKLPRLSKSNYENVDVNYENRSSSSEATPSQDLSEKNEDRKPALKVAEMISRNGLTELASEVKIVAGRLSKLLNYHLRGYAGLYSHLS